MTVSTLCITRMFSGTCPFAPKTTHFVYRGGETDSHSTPINLYSPCWCFLALTKSTFFFPRLCLALSFSWPGGSCITDKDKMFLGAEIFLLVANVILVSGQGSRESGHRGCLQDCINLHGVHFQIKPFLHITHVFSPMSCPPLPNAHQPFP